VIEWSGERPRYRCDACGAEFIPPTPAGISKAREEADPLAHLFPRVTTPETIAVPLIWFVPEEIEGIKRVMPSVQYDPALEEFFTLMESTGATYDEIPGAGIKVERKDSPGRPGPCAALLKIIDVAGERCLKFGHTGRLHPFMWLTLDNQLTGYTEWARILHEMITYIPRFKQCDDAFDETWEKLRIEHGLGEGH
jgi:hypothetical protein